MERGIGALPRQKAIMGPLLDDASLVDHDDAVGVLDGGQSMGDHQRRPALRQLGPEHGEVKSMHTAESARGRGVGSALLRRLMDTARARGMRRLSLETGSWPYFLPARALYARHGFVECPPFGDYSEDPNSVFMTLRL